MRRELVSATKEIRTAPLPPIDESVGRESFRAIDRMREALTAQWTAGLSPASLALAFFDWSIHLASAPGKRVELLDKAIRKSGRLMAHCATAAINPNTPACIEPLPGDHRFRAKEWHQRPYSFLAQAFLLNQQWWHNATHEVPGMTPHHEDVVSFAARQFLDLFSPSNFPFSNPEVIKRTAETGGANFIQGLQNWVEDAMRLATGQPPVGSENFQNWQGCCGHTRQGRLPEPLPN